MDRRRFARHSLTALACLPLARGVFAQATVAPLMEPLAAPPAVLVDAPAVAGVEAVAQIDELLFRAMSLIGTPYQRGGSSPATGFDCSGFVSYLYREVLGMKLPRSADAIWRFGQEVPRTDLTAGDLVFFNTMRRPYSHVGVYVAEDRFVHAPASGGAVRTESVNERYWARRWNGAKRLDT